ncbi:unnamed protein product [Ilex paraguariensis]|uniref:Peptidase A1 domain-containing protein n=1 Tax=Ilex paraguariensis TaxID=185542 RepID=A0ABC8RJ49_9AQUA
MSILSFSVTEAAHNGGFFTVDLIHRDSPKSPFHNPSLTPSQRLNNALQRSFNRVQHFRLWSPQLASADIIPTQGAFLMKISLGTPPVEIMAFADTGSDLIWTQCKPCDECFDQKSPLFNPISSSYKAIPCGSRQCQSLQDTYCVENSCQYDQGYGDSSSTSGDLATETVRLGSTSATGLQVSLPNTIFGCGHENELAFSIAGSGIVGLGGGSVSLISQMGASIGGKFSYCLVSMSAQNTKSSKMIFGGSGISVGDKRLNLYNSTTPSNASKDGNIIIDSGTTMTVLPSDLYHRLELAVKNVIKLPTIKDPEELLHLCYSNLADKDIPIIAVHFRGADLKLNPLNTFARTSSSSRCLAFAPDDDLSIYGNMAHMNFLVGYDLQKKTVSFKPTDCRRQ